MCLLMASSNRFIAPLPRFYSVVRSTVPKLELDEAFASKDEIARAVLAQLSEVMREYGCKLNAHSESLARPSCLTTFLFR